MQDQMEPASWEVIGPVNLEGDTQDPIVRGLGASQVYVFSTVGTGKPRGVFQQKKKKKVTYCFLKKITGAAVWAVMKSGQETHQGVVAKTQKALKVNWRKAEQWMDTGQVWEA